MSFIKNPNYKNILLFLLLFALLNNSSFASRRKRKKDAEKPQKKVINIEDTEYRIITVLPFKNMTGIKDYNFLGKSLQTFIIEECRNINNIKISSNDIEIPEEIKLNTELEINFGTNMYRRLIWLNAGSINPITEKIKLHNMEKIADLLETDYIIMGKYEKYNKDNWIFKLKLYNCITKTESEIHEIITDYKKVLDNIYLFFNEIEKEFNTHDFKKIYITSEPHNAEVLLNDKLIGQCPGSFYINPGKTNSLKIRSKNYQEVVFDANIMNTTNYVILERKNYDSYILIKTIPENCNVYLDIKYMGKTPLILTNIRYGTYRLHIKKSGFSDYYTRVRIKDKPELINIKMTSTNTTRKISQKRSQYKRLCYIFAGCGTLAVLATYIFYYNYDLNFARSFYSTDEKYTRYWKMYTISAWFTGCTGAIFYTNAIVCLVKFLVRDEVLANNQKTLKIAFSRKF